MSNDIETLWSILHGELEKIYRLDCMSVSTCSTLYTNIYNHCVTSTGQSSVTEPRLTQSSNIGGSDLYKKLKEYLENYVENLHQKALNLSDKELLTFYNKTWINYQVSSKLTNLICKYLNERWIKYQRDDHRTDIYPIFNLSLKIWENVLFKPLHQKVIGACFRLIETDRKEGTNERQLIKDVIQICVDLDSNDAQARSRSLIESAMFIYQEYFETPFLQETEQFYRIKANNYLNIVRISVVDYLKEVAKCFDEESKRVETYLHPSIKKALFAKLDNVLIREHLEQIYDEAKNLLQNKQNKDLALLFTLVSRIPNATNRLVEIFEEHIYQTGLRSIAGISATPTIDSKIYIENIVSIRTHFSIVVKESFNAVKEFSSALDKACVKFMNNNAVTQASPTGTKKSAEFLALYCDKILRRSKPPLDETVVEERLNEIMIIFQYIEDKDIFQRFYIRSLAKRLLDQLSASDVSEQSMVTKLQEACGVKYAKKLQDMLKDMQLNETLSQVYAAHCTNKTSNDTKELVDFSVMVLHQRIWSFLTPLSFIIPEELKARYEHFTSFYTTEIHEGRKLVWLHGRSRGELETTFTKRPYLLHVSLFQMHVLLLFNEELQWTVETIQNRTNIRADLLSQVLETLIKKQLLTCTQSTLEMTHTIQLSTDYTCERVRVNLDVPLRAIEQHDANKVNEESDDKRVFMLQARTMQVMKTRQTLKKSLLVNEVIELLRAKFVPKISMIDKCIEELISKNFLKWMPDDPNTLCYIA